MPTIERTFSDLYVYLVLFWLYCMCGEPFYERDDLKNIAKILETFIECQKTTEILYVLNGMMFGASYILGLSDLGIFFCLL